MQVLDNSMVYVTTDEKQLVDRLFNVKAPAAFYYKQGTKIGYHWNLHPITIAKMKIAGK